MTSRTTPAFRKLFSSLPPEIQDRAREAFHRFQDNPQHPGLRFKKVHPTRPIYSARISLSYRALALQTDEVDPSLLVAVPPGRVPRWGPAEPMLLVEPREMDS